MGQSVARNVVRQSNAGAQKKPSWAEIAKRGARPSLQSLPESYCSKLLEAKKKLKDAGFAPVSSAHNVPPPMEARYFSGFKRGPYKELIRLLRSATRNRAVVAISFIGRSILEIVTPSDKADRLVVGLVAIGYRHLKKFDPTKNAISTSKVMSSDERKKKNLEFARFRYQKGAHSSKSHWAIKWYTQQAKRISTVLEQVKSPSRMDVEPTSVIQPETPKGLDKFSTLRRYKRFEDSSSDAENTNRFAPLFVPPLTNMEIEAHPEPVSVLGQRQTGVPDQTPKPIPPRTVSHARNEVVATPNKHGLALSSPEQSGSNDSSDDSLPSDWDHDGAPTYDHELRRPRRCRKSVLPAETPLPRHPGPGTAKDAEPFRPVSKTYRFQQRHLRRAKSCNNLNFVYTPINKQTDNSRQRAKLS